MAVEIKDLEARRTAFQEYAEAGRETGISFREEVRLCRKAYAGSQLSEEVRSELRRTGRPDVAINRIRPPVDAVSGSETVNRFEPKFFPRNSQLESGDQEISEAFNEVYRYVRQESDAEHEESSAFRSSLIAGVGGTESFMDYEEDPEGKLNIGEFDLLEVGWDTAAKAQNLVDREWDFRGRWISRNRFAAEFPDADFPASRGDTGHVDMGVHDNDHPYAVWKAGSYFDPRRDAVLVVHHQWFETRRDTRIFTPLRDSFWVPKGEDVGEALAMERQMVASQGGDPLSVDFLEAPRRIYMEAWTAGSEFLVDPTEAPVNAFSRNFITGFKDEANEKAVYWFGPVRSAIDPQDVFNRLISSILHQIASNPKGAIAYESGAFTSKEEALRQWAMPNGALELKAGTLTSNRKPPYDVIKGSSLPDGMEQLSGLMAGLIPQVMGVNEAFFGGQAADLSRTANTAIQSVQRANQALLSVLFDSLRRYRKEHARMTIEFVRRYFPPEQILRVLGPNGINTLPFVKSNMPATYDIVIDEAPASVNDRMETFGLLMQHGIFQLMLEMGLVPPSLWDYIPNLPSDVRKDIAGLFEQQQAMAEAQAQAPPEAAPV